MKSFLHIAFLISVGLACGGCASKTSHVDVREVHGAASHASAIVASTALDTSLARESIDTRSCLTARSVRPARLSLSELGLRTVNVNPARGWYAYSESAGAVTAVPSFEFIRAAGNPDRAEGPRGVHAAGKRGEASGSLGIWTYPGVSLDLSAYAGLTFRAKGTGAIVIGVLTTDVDPPYCRCALVPPGSYESALTVPCYARYQHAYALSADWQPIAVPFTDLKQPDWGYLPGVLDAANITAIQFASDVASDWELWIDEVTLLPR